MYKILSVLKVCTIPAKKLILWAVLFFSKQALATIIKKN